MERIIIIGPTGAGKSTLAAQLACKYTLSLIELDDLYWLPGWHKQETGEFRRRAEERTRGQKWVAAGNHSVLRDIVWARADTLVWLDYSFFPVLSRIVRRSITRISDRQQICSKNIETWSRLLSRDSIVLWLLKSFWLRKKDFSAIFDNPVIYPHLSFIRLNSPDKTERWFKGLPP
jgi:adenylate kinase family enzyme